MLLCELSKNLSAFKLVLGCKVIFIASVDMKHNEHVCFMRVERKDNVIMFVINYCDETKSLSICITCTHIIKHSTSSPHISKHLGNKI